MTVWCHEWFLPEREIKFAPLLLHEALLLFDRISGLCKTAEAGTSLACSHPHNHFVFSLCRRSLSWLESTHNIFCSATNNILCNLNKSNVWLTRHCCRCCLVFGCALRTWCDTEMVAASLFNYVLVACSGLESSLNESELVTRCSRHIWLLSTLRHPTKHPLLTENGCAKTCSRYLSLNDVTLWGVEAESDVGRCGAL